MTLEPSYDDEDDEMGDLIEDYAEQESALTLQQLDALTEFARQFNRAITEMWEAVKPALVRIAEIVREAHDRDGCIRGEGNACIVCGAGMTGGPE